MRHLPEVRSGYPSTTKRIESELSLTQRVKSGQVTYDVRTETTFLAPPRTLPPLWR